MQLGKSRQPSQGGEAGKGLRSNDRDVPLSGGAMCLARSAGYIRAAHHPAP